MSEIIKKTDNEIFLTLPLIQVRKEAEDFAKNFITKVEPAQRVFATYVLKRLIEFIEKYDRIVQNRFLEEEYNAQLNSGYKPELFGISIQQRKDKIIEYTDNERANQIKEKIEELKAELKSLEKIVGFKNNYYLKEQKS